MERGVPLPRHGSVPAARLDVTLTDLILGLREDTKPRPLSRVEMDFFTKLQPSTSSVKISIYLLCVCNFMNSRPYINMYTLIKVAFQIHSDDLFKV